MADEERNESSPDPVTSPPIAWWEKFPWLPIAFFSVLAWLSYSDLLKVLFAEVTESEDYSHAIFVPLISGFLLWQRRAELAAMKWEPNYLWGTLGCAFFSLQHMIAHMGGDPYLQRTSIVGLIVAAVLLFGGWKVLKACAFPLALLIFSIPLPHIVYRQLTLPLQLFASEVAENALTLLGIPVYRDGNVIELANQKLSVVEACSGIRSLLSLSYLSLIYAYFFDPKVWMRIALLIATVPIAIVANSGRVTATGIITEFDPELAKGFFHSLEGWVVFVVALSMLIGAHSLINFVYRRVRKAT